MRGRDLGFFVCGGAVALLLAAILFFSLSSQEERLPEIAGQQVPKAVHRIDFSKRYDFVISAYGGERVVYRNCRIVGVTGDREDSGGGSSDSYYGWDKWIVLELPDKRLAYIPPNNVFIIEQAATVVAPQ